MFKKTLALIRFDENGLVPAIVQDPAGTVLMVAYMNREALEKTLSTRTMHYYSRSRKRLWLKGESSGNTQTVREVRVDCDADAILFTVEQKGAACHEGYYTCFFRRVAGESIETVGERLFDPKEVYKNA